MMNPFSTGYRFILRYIETRRFVSLKEAIHRLRKEGKIEEEKKLILDGQSRWIEDTAPKLGMTFEVHGEENIPDHGPFMIYSNHQGFADIPATLWLMKDRYQLGYVAKEEWKKYPTLKDVVESTRSIFLVRDNPKEAIKALKTGVEITRFKGLGEISSNEFVDFIGENMRLDPVKLSDEESISDIMSFYMGDNTIERQNFIRENLRSEEELEDVNI